MDENGKKYAKLPNCAWFTNLPTKKRTEELILFRKFEQSKYPMYDNYLAFNVDKVADIPADKDIVIDTDKETYEKFVNSNQQFDLMETDEVNYKLRIKNPIWGVPITFLDNYCPKQFEILWQLCGNTRKCAPTEILQDLNYCSNKEDRGGCGTINNKRVYTRILIKRI